MMGFEFGLGLLGLLGMLGGVGSLVGIVLLIVWAVRRSAGNPADDALMLLRARYARGEIDAAQLGEMTSVLGPDERASRRDAIGIVGVVLLVVSIVATMATPLLFTTGWWGTGGPCPPTI